jgi:replicative DNA helicase
VGTTELKVLNSICNTKNIQPVLAGSNVDKMFDGYSDVWQFIKGYYSEHRAIPDVSILESRFNYFEAVEVPGETGYYVDMLREEYINSELERVTLKLRDKVGKIASGAVLQGVLGDLMELQNISVKSQDRDITDFDNAMKEYEETRLLAEQMGGVPGISTGIDFIDQAYQSGLAGGDLIVVLGWTGRAKSLLTTMICVNAFNKGFKPMIISLEMNTKKVQDRAYTMMGKGLFKNSDLAVGDIKEDDFRSWSNGINKGNGFVVVSHDGNNEITPAVVQSKIDQHKPDIIVLDYAQLMSDNANSSDMTARMRNMSKEFKRLATSNNIPIILISSATPDSTASINTPPIIEQVAWSKQLSFDADLAFAVHRHDPVESMMEAGWVIIEIAGRKNRNGELFSGYFKANINEGIYQEFFSLEDIGNAA